MELRADYVVVGGGIAGLRALADLVGTGDILLLTKAGPTESNTGYAQGGIAAALGRRRFARPARADTCAGDGLCDEAAVDVLVQEGPRVRAPADRVGRRVRSRCRRTAGAGTRRRAQRAARAARAATRPAARSARALWARVEGAGGLRVDPEGSRDRRSSSRTGWCRGVRFFDARTETREPRGAGGAARDRRRGPGVPRDDESGDRHRRRHRDGVACGCARGRSRVRPVPPDRA